MAKKTQPNRAAAAALQTTQQQQHQQHQQKNQKPSLPPPPSPPPSAPKSKTSGAAKKKNKKKAAQARQLDSINHLDQLNDNNTDSNSLIGRSDMIGAYPAEDAVSITQRTTTGSISPDEDDDDRITSHTMHPSLAAATRQTQEDLLATANDLYRQIESAAAAALATTQYPKNSNSILNSSNQNQSSTNHQSGHSNSNNHSPHPDDDAYWTSLPAHLRSFIRSALPLAAGHSSSNINQSQSSAQNQGAILPNLSSFAHATGMVTSTTTSSNQQSVPQLTSEQMAAAAEQLARVVQSHDWGRAVSTAAQQAGLSHTSVMNHIINGTARSSHNYSRDGSSAAATVSVTGGTVTGTIPLGSFTLPLPLHAHPEQHQHQNSHGLNEPVYYTGETTIVTSRIGDKHNGDDGLLDDGYYSDDARGMRGDINHAALSNRHNHSEQASNASNIGVNNSSPAMTTTTSSKKKKKNKKKKAANAGSNEATQLPPVPNVDVQRSSPALSSNPVVPPKVPSQPNPSTRKPGIDSPAVHLANQALSPNAAAPASRLPPVPTATQKKKSSATNPLSSNVNNSASSSTVTNTNSNNTSHQPTERERIRVFWLTLNQEERANLVKIEKDAVLKKMKEQQRHSCSCAVCGRKRLAIEQELEVLYDAYYDELENYAEASKKYYGSDLKAKGDKGLPGAYPKPPGPGPFPGSVDIMMTATQPSSQVASKKAVPKPTRDHKNIRPRPQQAVPQQTHPPPQSTNGANGHYQQPPGAAKRNLPPPSQLKKLNSHNSNSDHDHTHSPSCPHHPHHHGPNHYHPSNRGKGVANAHCIPPAAHQRTHPRTEDAFPDEEAEEDEDEDEYDDEDEEEYDEDEDEEGEFEDDDEIPALEEVPSETLVPNNAHKKPPINGANMPYPNKLTNGDKPSSTHANNSDLFGFGNSLTVKGILTVADDLLRNDGQKFLEMMESLADKRIQRERDAAENLLAGLEDDENEGDDYDEDEEEDDELEDDDGFDDEIITEEYRMKEGRRMFQIFAARMFEQRVLTAYREKVAQEKQAQLLRELEDEDRQAQERELKKVKDAQKKKEKKKAQKQQKDQDLAKKLKDKEAEEQAAKAAEEARLEAEKRKQEEQRIKREAQRKLQEAERAKREEERKKRIEEETRKRKEKEEKIRQEKEARIAKEREEREKKVREEAEKKSKVDAERKEKEAKEAKAKEELARKKKAETAKREAEEAAKREAAKTAAAKLAAQNKNAIPNAKPTQRSPVSVRSPMTPKPINTSIKMPPSSAPHNLPMPNTAFQPHTPNRPMLPPPMLPRQMSVGIGLGRPASAAAAPPFSAAIPPMAGPSSYSSIPARPPSAQYPNSFPASNAYAPPGCLQNIPPDMHVPMNGIQGPLVGGPFMPMGTFQPPMGPMVPSANNRAFSGSAIAITAQHNYITPTSQPHQPSQHQRPSIVSSLPPSTPTHPSGIMSPGISSASSPLSALHLGSEPVSKASVSAVGPIGPSSAHPRRPSGIDEALIQGGFFANSIEPIGRPKVNGTSNAMEVSSVQSDRDSTPGSADASPIRSAQNVLGSSALLADDEAGANFPRRHTMPTNVTPTSRKTSGFPAPPGFDRVLAVGSSIWGTSLPAVGADSGWGAAVLTTPPPPVVTPRTPLQPPSLGGVVQPSGTNPPRENTSDWIRRRAISAYCNMRLNEKWIPVGDVSIEMQRIHLDTLNVSLKDMVDACLVKRNIHNGGGDWQFSQQGPVLYTRWLPVSSQEASLGTSSTVS